MITIKTKEEIELMAKGGKILKSVIDKLGKYITVGISGKDIEKIADKLIEETGGIANFKGQDGFPSCLCFSINEEIVHGTPDERVLKNGDIVTLDIGIFFPLNVFLEGSIDYKKYPNLKNGFHTDMARTYIVGEADFEIQRLVKANKKALKRGISQVKAGNKFGQIGSEIEKFATKEGYNVIKDLCGHGIGSNLHEDPDVLNYGDKKWGEIMKEGMVFCIEPMLSLGSDEIIKKGTSYVTEDNSLTAHFEDMVAVTKNGVIILTL
ncbi:MAG: type I methionyl aminopeptidase [Candidatus Pacebacteria bacterium]|nr:type I methionyl aminopeptidase [Candidatus Paceibacterota bacterium]